MPVTPSSQRDYLFDNIKFVLITFVVFAHFIEPYIDQSATIKGLFVGIYFFHIPFFVFISGYFSKSAASQNIENNLRNLLVPYLIFSAAWYLKDDLHARINNLSVNVIVPPFHLWYLLSLFFWRLTLRVAQKIKFYFVLSIVAALIIGFSPDIGQSLSLSRTIVLFPFFILGTLCPEHVIKDLHKKKYLIPIGIIAWCAFDYWMITYYPQTFSIVFGDEPYIIEAGSNLMGLMERSILFIVAILSSLAILALTPGKKLFISAIGAKTMPIYVFHAFLVPRFSVIFPLWNDSVYKNAIILIFPLVLVWILSFQIFEDIYMYITGLFQQMIRKTESQVKHS